LTHFGAYLKIYDGFIDAPTHATGSAGNEFAMVNVRETARAAMVLLGRTHAELFEATLRASRLGSSSNRGSLNPICCKVQSVLNSTFDFLVWFFPLT
jgi:hypothetical protein